MLCLNRCQRLLIDGELSVIAIAWSADRLSGKGKSYILLCCYDDINLKSSSDFLAIIRELVKYIAFRILPIPLTSR